MISYVLKIYVIIVFILIFINSVSLFKQRKKEHEFAKRNTNNYSDDNSKVSGEIQFVKKSQGGKMKYLTNSLSKGNNSRIQNGKLTQPKKNNNRIKPINLKNVYKEPHSYAVMSGNRIVSNKRGKNKRNSEMVDVQSLKGYFSNMAKMDSFGGHPLTTLKHKTWKALNNSWKKEYRYYSRRYSYTGKRTFSKHTGYSFTRRTLSKSAWLNRLNNYRNFFKTWHSHFTKRQYTKSTWAKGRTAKMSYTQNRRSFFTRRVFSRKNSKYKSLKTKLHCTRSFYTKRTYRLQRTRTHKAVLRNKSYRRQRSPVRHKSYTRKTCSNSVRFRKRITKNKFTKSRSRKQYKTRKLGRRITRYSKRVYKHFIQNNKYKTKMQRSILIRRRKFITKNIIFDRSWIRYTRAVFNRRNVASRNRQSGYRYSKRNMKSMRTRILYSNRRKRDLTCYKKRTVTLTRRKYRYKRTNRGRNTYNLKTLTRKSDIKKLKNKNEIKWKKLINGNQPKAGHDEKTDFLKSVKITNKKQAKQKGKKIKITNKGKSEIVNSVIDKEHLFAKLITDYSLHGHNQVFMNNTMENDTKYSLLRNNYSNITTEYPNNNLNRPIRYIMKKATSTVENINKRIKRGLFDSTNTTDYPISSYNEMWGSVSDIENTTGHLNSFDIGIDSIQLRNV